MSDPVILDAKGLSCPLPVLRTRKRMGELPAGGLLRVLTTDPGSVEDFAAYCQTSGAALLESGVEDGVYSFLIRKPG